MILSLHLYWTRHSLVNFPDPLAFESKTGVPRGPKSLNFPDGNFQRAKTFRAECVNRFRDKKKRVNRFRDKWLAIAKLKPLSLFISVLLMFKKALDNVKMEK